MAEFVVDTHALIWYLEGNPRLGVGAGSILDDSESELYLPATALAEALWIVEHGRTKITSTSALLSDIEADPRVKIIPPTAEIVRISANLATIPEMHDRQIVATAIILGNPTPLPLLTRDVNITISALVPVIW